MASPSPQPRRRLAPLAIAAAVVLAVGAGAGLWLHERYVTQPRLAEEAFEIIRTDVPAPDLPLFGPDGKPFSISQFRGQVLFVNFWATWCPPCVEEMPSMLRLGRELTRAHPGKFRMVTVSADRGWDDIQIYFHRYFGGPPGDLTQALDSEGRVAQAYYCTARGVCPDIKFPETYIVDRRGRLVAYIVSNRDWSDPAARRFLERLIDG